MSNQESEIVVSIGELIAIHRDRLHMTQGDLANAAKVSRNYISLLERGGGKHVSIDVLGRIFNILDLEIKITHK